ncbi:MAG: M20/M25/M40 family metallo-hydrolase, partial [Planctomycetota bacterium]
RERRAGRLASLRVDLHWQPDATLAHNVVARLRGGAEGEQAREAVVLSAHIDHLGTREPAETPAEGEAPDLIYNGADDDASGVAALLEVAEALGLGPRPAREVIVLFATGEERGLLGTFEYLERPAVPLERTVYNLNFEMLGRPDALAGGAGQMWFTGYERTTVGPALAELGIALTPDPRPEEMFFQRSDNIAFVLRDIPGQTLSSYDLHDDYHTPGDEWQTLDYEHMAAAVALAVRATRAIVDGSVPLDWVEGGRLQRR